MGNKQSQFIIWGPTSINIYQNPTTRKKVMFIGDKHQIPKEQPGISLNAMFDRIKVNKGVGFITEGCADSVCLIDEEIDNCMKRAQLCQIVDKKFDTLWGDHRQKTSIYDMHISTVSLNIYLTMFMGKWNNADPEMKANIQEIMDKSIKKVFAAYKKIVKWKGEDLVENTMKEYPKFMKLLGKLSGGDRDNIFVYLSNNIYKGSSQQEFISRYNKEKYSMVGTMKGIFTSFKAGAVIKQKDYFQYISVISYMKKTMHDVSDTIFEAYMIMLVLSTKYERYIIHAGAIHIYNMEEWFKSTLGYDEYFAGKRVGDLLQAIDIGGLQFV
jgi:hypothetical protein